MVGQHVSTCCSWQQLLVHRHGPLAHRKTAKSWPNLLLLVFLQLTTDLQMGKLSVGGAAEQNKVVDIIVFCQQGWR